MTITSIQAGKIICELSGWETSTLRLQKLLYITHLFYTGEQKEPLIKEDFQAWRFGPVEPKLYRYCKGFGSNPIPNIFPMDVGVDEEGTEYEYLERFVEATQGDKHNGKIDEGFLIGFTHRKNGAWDRLYNPEKRNIIIPYQYIVDEYNRFEKGK